MRRAMRDAVTNIIRAREDVALLCIDIGAYGFRNLISEYPKRARNIGIFEQGTISLAAGLSLSGITPIVYGISPFIAQRSLEQLKLDFAYQMLGGNFITTGATYDFSTLGYSHYCPDEYTLIRNIPGIEFLSPATPSQFRELFDKCVTNGKPSYFRMTDYCNTFDCSVTFGKANVIRRGEKGLVIAVAETLDYVIKACENLDVTILYYTTLIPFDTETLVEELRNEKIFIVSPFYEGAFLPEIFNAIGSKRISIGTAEVPLQIIRSYGTKKEKDEKLGLDAKGIRKKILLFINGKEYME